MNLWAAPWYQTRTRCLSTIYIYYILYCSLTHLFLPLCFSLESGIKQTLTHWLLTELFNPSNLFHIVREKLSMCVSAWVRLTLSWRKGLRDGVHELLAGSLGVDKGQSWRRNLRHPIFQSLHTYTQINVYAHKGRTEEMHNTWLYT